MYKIIVILFLSLQLQAQLPFAIEPNPSYGTGESTDNFFNADAEIFNLTDSTLELGWRRVLQNIPSGWESATCLNFTCLPTDVENGEFSVESGFTLDLISTFYPNDVAGEGEVHLKVWMKNDTSIFINQVYFGNAEPTNIVDLNIKKQYLIVPNPVSNSFSLEENMEYETLEIYTAQGQRIETFERLPQYNIDHFPTNIYFVRVYSKQKELLTVLKLTKL